MSSTSTYTDRSTSRIPSATVPAPIIVDVRIWPLGHVWDVAADLVELDDAQRLVGTMVLQQGLETLCGGEVFERKRALAAVFTPQHAVGVSCADLLGVDACHNP
jgi:hypothetical protein